MMANGGLVRVLIHTNVTKYLNFKAVDGSYVYNKGKVWTPTNFYIDWSFVYHIDIRCALQTPFHNQSPFPDS